MTYQEVQAWVQDNILTIIAIVLFLLMQIPSFAEKLGWYTKKRREYHEAQKRERKAEYDQWTSEFIKNYIPEVTKGYDAKIKVTEDHYKEIDKKLTDLISANVDLMRNEMKKIYYKYRKVKKIPEYDKQTFLKFYESYHKLGGNTFIDGLYSEVKKWETVPSIDDLPEILN